MRAEQLQDETRFAAVARSLAAAIDSGALRAGDKLPSVRALSREQGVSMTTALRALRLLESQGYAAARPQSGYFAQRPTAMVSPPPSQPPARDSDPEVVTVIDRLLAESASSDCFPMGEAIPARELLPLRAIARRISRLAYSEGPELLGRLSGQGLPELRAAIAARMARAGCSVHPDAIVVTGGAADAVALALRAVTAPGDCVAMESPTYYGLLMTAAGLGLRARELPTDPGTGLCIDAFEALCRSTPPRALVLSSNAQNPTGACMTEASKAAVVRIAARYGVRIIEDDVFGELARHAGTGLRCLKAYDPGDTVIYCSSFSKVLAPGLRIGWVVPGDAFDAILRQRIAQSWGAPLLSQRVLAQTLREASYEQHMRRLVRALADTRLRALDSIRCHFPAGTRAGTGEYGFLLWLQLPGGIDGHAFYRAALERGVAVMPGFVFSGAGGFDDYVRLSLGQPWSDALADALRRLAALAHDMLARGPRLSAPRPGEAVARRAPAESA